MLGHAAAAAGKTGTFLGERYRRLVRRPDKLKALVAVARSVMVIVWHLLADRTARYQDLGAGYYASWLSIMFGGAMAVVVAGLSVFVYARTGSDLLAIVEADLASRADLLAVNAKDDGPSAITRIKR